VDPKEAWVYLKRLREEYEVWSELGEIPRRVLPAGVRTEPVGRDEEDKPVLPPSTNTESRVKVYGG